MAPCQPGFKAKCALACAMATLLGWTDVLAFLRIQCFATMMTGNLILLSISTVERIASAMTAQNNVIVLGHHKEPTVYLSALGSWVLGTFFYRVVSARSCQAAATVFAPFVALSTVIVFVISSRNGFLVEPYTPYLEACGLAPVFAVASAATARNGISVICNIFTGHLQLIGFDFVLVLTRDPGAVEALKRIGLSAMMVTSFLLGCALAAGTQELLLHSSQGQEQEDLQRIAAILLLPVGPVMACLLVLHDFMFIHPRVSEQAQQVEEEAAGRPDGLHALSRSLSSFFYLEAAEQDPEDRGRSRTHSSSLTMIPEVQGMTAAPAPRLLGARSSLGEAFWTFATRKPSLARRNSS